MTSDDHEEAQLALALARYEIIGRYLALDPPRGQRRQVLEQLAAKPWPWVGGDPIEVSAETLRVWIHQQRELICTLKRDVPERSLDRIITIAEELALVAPGVLKRSTVHRVLQEQGISARAARVPDTQDLDRFEAGPPILSTKASTSKRSAAGVGEVGRAATTTLPLANS